MELLQSFVRLYHTPQPLLGQATRVNPSTINKYLEVQDKVVSAKDYDKARDQWKKEKEKSNKKAQEELEKHVK